MVAKKKKSVTIKVAGVSKKISLMFIEEKTPFGVYRLLDAREVDAPKVELILLAEKIDEAIISIYGKIFPPAKTARIMAEQLKTKTKKPKAKKTTTSKDIKKPKTKKK